MTRPACVGRVIRQELLVVSVHPATDLGVSLSV
jgi:hypothetical protein